MDTILDMTKYFLSSVCFCLLLTDVAWDNIFLLLILGNFIGNYFGGMASFTAIMVAMSL